jgi:hypothetical protein
LKKSGRSVLPIRISGRFFDAGGKRWRLVKGGGSRWIMQKQQRALAGLPDDEMDRTGCMLDRTFSFCLICF